MENQVIEHIGEAPLLVEETYNTVGSVGKIEGLGAINTWKLRAAYPLDTPFMVSIIQGKIGRAHV